MVENNPLRIAYTADIHLTDGQHGLDYDDAYDLMHAMAEKADAIVIAGDLTDDGTPDQVNAITRITRDITVPMYAVLGNHDRMYDNPSSVKERLTEEGGIIMLPGKVHTIKKNGTAIDVVGVEGGYDGSFVWNLPDRHVRQVQSAGRRLDDDMQTFRIAARRVKNPAVAVFHYAPDQNMVQGKDSSMLFKLGSNAIGVEVDRFKTRFGEVIHGHVHRGNAHGRTKTGIPITNVAIPVLSREAQREQGETYIDDLFVVREY